MFKVFSHEGMQFELFSAHFGHGETELLTELSTAPRALRLLWRCCARWAPGRQRGAPRRAAYDGHS